MKALEFQNLAQSHWISSYQCSQWPKLYLSTHHFSRHRRYSTQQGVYCNEMCPLRIFFSFKLSLSWLAPNQLIFSPDIPSTKWNHSGLPGYWHISGTVVIILYTVNHLTNNILQLMQKEIVIAYTNFYITKRMNKPAPTHIYNCQHHYFPFTKLHILTQTYINPITQIIQHG